MADASSTHPAVLASGDAGGQSNSGVGGATATNSSAASGGFVALDVGALSSLAGEAVSLDSTAATAAVAASPRPPRTPKMVRSLSRKGERKPADCDGNGSAGSGVGERPQLFVHVAAGDLGDASGGGARLVVHTPVAGTPSGKSRRLGRRPAPWLDPRRVVFLFATLSSVGTLILLYFTLAMSRTDSSGGAAAAASDAR